MKLKNTVLQGWPTNRKDLDSELTPYWNFRDEISIVEGLLLKGNRIITPEQLRPVKNPTQQPPGTGEMYTTSQINIVLARNYRSLERTDRAVQYL